MYLQFIKKCLFKSLKTFSIILNLQGYFNSGICTSFHLCNEQFTIFTPYDVLQFDPSLVTIGPAASCHKISLI